MKRKKYGKKKARYNLLQNVLYMLKIQYNVSRTSVVLYILAVITSLGLTFLSAYLPRTVTFVVENRLPFSEATVYIGTIGLFYILTNSVNQWIHTYGGFLLTRITIELTSRKTQKILTTDYENIESAKCRDAIQKADEALWTTGIGSGAERMVINTYDLLINVFSFLLFGSFLSFASPWITVILTVLPLLNYFAITKAQRYQYNNHDVTSSLDRKLWYIANACGAFDGAKDVRIYGMNQWLLNVYRGLTKERLFWDRKHTCKFLKASVIEALLLLFRDSFAYILLIVMVTNNQISLADFVFYFYLVGNFAGWVGGVLDNISKLNATSLCISELREFLEYPEKNNRCIIHQSAKINTQELVTIDFENVTFRYPNAENNTINNINLHIKKGEKIAIVGLNGAGKTTLIKCLCGLYSCTEGIVRINGKKKEDYNIYDYYGLFSVVFQDYYLLPVTIAEMISGVDSPQIDYQLVKRCLDMSGLSEKISELKEGIHTKINKQINENGIDLSGGEKQKLLLARAIYKDAPILVLDEPTAALDPIAESQLYAKYHELTKNKTSFFISHRLSSTRFCDRILYMENGEIIEEGSHDELMALNGKYAALFEVQSHYYKERGTMHE